MLAVGRNEMNWNLIKEYADKWVSVSNISIPYASVGEDLLKLSETAYLFIVPYNRDFEGQETGPYISMALWAQSEGAVRRAYMREIHADQGDNGKIPPSSFCVEPNMFSYQDILKLAMTNKYGSYMEHASYPYMGEGKDAPFLHRTVSVSGFEFHFRSRDDDKNETPYVIAYRGKRPIG